MPKPLSETALKILEIIKQHPSGISEGDIKALLKIPTDEQAQFGRRRRELNAYYRFSKKHVGKKVLYVFQGPLEKPKDSAPINQKDRARALFESRGRCGLCGRHRDTHGISLVVDHHVPRDWGGKTEPDNLWALCEECNAGKKNFFKTVDSDLMKKVMKHPSVRVRIGETLKAFNGKPVPGLLLEFVANQDDWKKRTRDLRYLGWKIAVTKKRVGTRVRSFYAVERWRPRPDNPDAVVSNYERTRREQNETRRKESKP